MFPTENRPDDELLRTFAAEGDEAAFAALVHRHGPLVLSVCRRLLHDVHDAEDAFQATFLVLARRAGSVRNPASLASWLYGVAQRQAGKMRVRSSRRRQRERPAPAAAPPDPCAEVTWQELRGLLDEELGRLPDRYRVTLLLCYWEGLTQDEASRRLGWPRGTFKRRLERARELLRTRLSRRGLILPAALAAVLLANRAAVALPHALLKSTVVAATAWKAHGSGNGAGLAGEVAGLAARVLRTLLLNKATLLVAVLLVGACFLVGPAGIPRLARAEKLPADQPGGRRQPGKSPSEPGQGQELPEFTTDRFTDPVAPNVIA
jgi:RNA polymerase sigma factor (sigma-70 family)